LHASVPPHVLLSWIVPERFTVQSLWSAATEQIWPVPVRQQNGTVAVGA
jgi:hypothetical protein